jgi:phosphate uptake regulator
MKLKTHAKCDRTLKKFRAQQEELFKEIDQRDKEVDRLIIYLLEDR